MKMLYCTTFLMKTIYLYLVIVVAGAAVLTIEILGTRILGPFYGVDIFLWSSLITVTLVGLSIGYLAGGTLADRSASSIHLAYFTGGAGIWIILIPLIKHPFLTLAEPLGLRAATLLASLILFFPPLALLGMVSPYVVRLKVGTIDEVGRTAGRLYALSTAASVVSALTTGFFLIPNVGVNRLTFITGMILLAVGVTGMLILRRGKGTIGGATALLVVAFLVGRAGSQEAARPEDGLLAFEQSPYAEIRVLDTRAGRHLLIDGGIHSLVDTAGWTSEFHYTAVMELPTYFYDKPGKMLLIGLGAGSLLKQYARRHWRVDAVEIDPDVIEVAYRHFGLIPKDGSVWCMDGRQYLMSTDEQYNLILLDAFGSSSIPFQLTTVEAFGSMASHLTPDGILAVNVEAIGWHDPIVSMLTVTLGRVFREVLTLPMEEPPDRFGNIVLLASNRHLAPRREPPRNDALDPDWRFGPGYQIVHAWDNRFIADTAGFRPLTDDLNPIDVRAGAINLASRQDLHEYFRGRASW